MDKQTLEEAFRELIKQRNGTSILYAHQFKQRMIKPLF